MKLSGPGSFHAAVHCATVSAAKRMRTNMGKRRRDGRPQLDHLRVSDSANSLDLDMDTLDPFPTSPSMHGTSPPIAQQVVALSSHAAGTMLQIGLRRHTRLLLQRSKSLHN